MAADWRKGMSDNRPVGVFDSGAGGVSVLGAMLRRMPSERFVYFGDSAYTPYGGRPLGWIRGRCETIVDGFVESHDVKAVVVACNTATAAAVDGLRATYDQDILPIIGIEPAVKPASLAFPKGRVLVMATETTLALDRFHMLVDRWENVAEIVPVPCPGLADRIELGNLAAPDVREMIGNFVEPWIGRCDAVVLGCTHYPFVAGTIQDVLGGVPTFDGAEGTARRLDNVLSEANRLAVPDGVRASRVSFLTSGTDESIRLYQRLLDGMSATPIAAGSTSAQASTCVPNDMRQATLG